LFGASSKSYSPAYLLERIDKRNLANQLPPAWLLIHGHRDPIVPFESSKALFDALQDTGIENLVLDTYPELDHKKYLYDLLLDHFEPFGIFTKIKEYHERAVLTKKYKGWLQDVIQLPIGTIASGREDFQR
jgi:fermentation-respiration switch protein FrsA (DUF1100 family)